MWAKGFHVPNLFGFNDHSWVNLPRENCCWADRLFVPKANTWPAFGNVIQLCFSHFWSTSDEISQDGDCPRESFKSIMFFLSWYSIWWCLTLYDSCISLCRQTVHICIIMINCDDKIHLMHSCSYGIFVFFWFDYCDEPCWHLVFLGFFLDFVDMYVEDQPIDSKPMRMNVPWAQWISWMIHWEIMDTVEKSDFAPKAEECGPFILNHFIMKSHSIDWAEKKHIKLLLRYSIMEIRKVIGDVAWMKKTSREARDGDLPFDTCVNQTIWMKI